MIKTYRLELSSLPVYVINLKEDKEKRSAIESQLKSYGFTNITFFNGDVPANADAYYLGNSIFGLYGGSGKKKIALEQFDEQSFRIYNMLAAHAIVYLNKEYIEFLERATAFQLSIRDNQDKARAETMKYWNIYSAAKPMFYQNGVHEPVTKRVLPGKSYGGPEEVHTI